MEASAGSVDVLVGAVSVLMTGSSLIPCALVDVDGSVNLGFSLASSSTSTSAGERGASIVYPLAARKVVAHERVGGLLQNSNRQGQSGRNVTSFHENQVNGRLIATKKGLG
jgi:hypothetical protein